MNKNEVLTYYYRRYKFIGLSVNDFDSLITSSCGDLSDNDKIIDTIIDYTYSLISTGSKPLNLLFKVSIKCLNPSDVFEFFDKLIKKYDLNISDEDIKYMSKINELQEFYRTSISEKMEEDKAICIGETILDKVLSVWTENEDDKDYSSSDIFAILQREISKIPVLTPDQEKDLFTRLKNGEDVKEQIAMGNLRLVKEAAVKKMAKRRLSKDRLPDLFQEGYFGLIRAIELFDVGRNNKFSTYAYDWIESKMDRYIDSRIRNIYIPAHKTEEINKLCKIMNMLNRQGIDNPSVDDIVAVSDFTPKQVIDLITLIDDTVSLDVKVDSDDRDADTMLNFMSSEESNGDYVEDIYQENKIVDLYKAIDMFDEKTKTILYLNYGLTDKGRITREVIAKMYGVTHQRISDIVDDALDVLRIILRDYSTDYEQKPIYDGIKLNFDNYDEAVNLHKRFECFTTFLGKVKDKGYKILEFYVYDYKVKIKCDECNTEQVVDPLLLTSYNYKCNECSRLAKIAKYQKEIDVTNPNIIIIDYQKVRIPAKFRCNCCGCEWESYIDQVLRNPDCVSCGKGRYRSSKKRKYKF